MAIAYNSAYVQTEIFNFHLRPASHYVLWCKSGHFACVKRYILYISPQHPLRSWTWLYHQKANETYIPTVYYPYGNIVNKVPLVVIGRPKFTPKTAPSLSTITTKTPIPRPTPLTTPNGIRIQSAVSPQLIFADRRTYTQTDALGECSVPWALLLAMLTESDALIMENYCPMYTESGNKMYDFLHFLLFRSLYQT